MNIKFGRDEKEIGDYPEEAVPALLQSKVLRGSDLFWHEGMNEWGTVESKWPAVLPPSPVPTQKRPDLLAETFSRSKTSGRWKFLVLIGVFLVGGLRLSLFLADKWKEHVATRNQIEDQELSNDVVDAFQRALEKNIQKAILKGRAILWMSKSEVRQAKGWPEHFLDGRQIPDQVRAQGVVEIWDYGSAYGPHDLVYFDRDGMVVYSTDSRQLRDGR